MNTTDEIPNEGGWKRIIAIAALCIVCIGIGVEIGYEVAHVAELQARHDLVDDQLQKLKSQMHYETDEGYPPSDDYLSSQPTD